MSVSGGSTVDTGPACMEAVERPAILPSGSMLGCYRIESFLAQGGFGITYIARDTMLDMQVAIKEYLPETIASRGADATVQARRQDDHPVFHRGLTSFLKEARTLARFKHPNIVRVMSIFELNGTAYMVMEYERGQDLKLFLSRQPQVSEATLKSIIGPIMAGLDEVHRHGFIHRDIKPANILVRDDGSPVLLDFGSARLASGGNTEVMTTLVSVGYAPLEQYSGMDEQQGPWTDIYALGAVLYFAITGNAPLESTLRGAAILNDRADPMLSLSQRDLAGYSRSFCRAVDWALQFKVTARPQSLVQWRSRLFNDLEPQAPSSGLSYPLADENIDTVTGYSSGSSPDTVALDTHDAPATEMLDTMVIPKRHDAFIDGVQTPTQQGRGRTFTSESSIKTSDSQPTTADSVHATVASSDLSQTSKSTQTTEWVHSSTDLRPALPVNTPRKRGALLVSRVALMAVVVGFAVLVFLFSRSDSSPEPTALLEQSLANKTTPILPDKTLQDSLSVADTENLATSDMQAEITDAALANNSASSATTTAQAGEAIADDTTATETLPEQASLDAQQSAESTRLAAELSRQQARERAVQRAEARRLALQAARDAEEADERRKQQEASRREAEQQAREDEQRRVESLAARSAIKPSISSADMDEVLAQFSILSNAIEQKDEITLQEVTVASERKNAYFNYVFTTFEAIEVTVNDISASREDQTIRATLTIEKMTRSNGDIAIPPEEFQNIAIYSVRETGWSAIYW